MNKHCYKSYNLQKESSGSCLHNVLTWHFHDPAMCNKNSITRFPNCCVTVRTFRTDTNNKVYCSVSSTYTISDSLFYSIFTQHATQNSSVSGTSAN